MQPVVFNFVMSPPPRWAFSFTPFLKRLVPGLRLAILNFELTEGEACVQNNSVVVYVSLVRIGINHFAEAFSNHVNFTTCRQQNTHKLDRVDLHVSAMELDIAAT